LESDSYAKISALVQNAEGIKIGIEEKSMNATEITIIGSVFETSLNMAKDLLTTLNDEMLKKEKAIESLLPKKNYLWEKNITLKERMASAVEMVSNPERYGLKQTLENLPKFLSNLDECVATIVAYSERKELLLNYPTAETAIENQLGTGNQVFAHDLPFEAKHSEEFLKLFYSHKYPDFSFDEENMVLARKA
jgi:hypothetical protein